MSVTERCGRNDWCVLLHGHKGACEPYALKCDCRGGPHGGYTCSGCTS